jgi:hypothetical protein
MIYYRDFTPNQKWIWGQVKNNAIFFIFTTYLLNGQYIFERLDLTVNLAEIFIIIFTNSVNKLHYYVILELFIFPNFEDLWIKLLI